MEFTNEEAIEYVIKKAEEKKGIPFKEIPESELDSIWIEFEGEGDYECSLVGRVNDEYVVWFMVEREGMVHSDSSNYKQALGSYRSLLLTPFTK